MEENKNLAEAKVVEEPVAAAEKAVSYTHLTLPTKLEV